MLVGNEKKQLERIENGLKSMSVRKKKPLGVEDNRKYFDFLRNALNLYEDVVRRCRKHRIRLKGKDYKRLRNLAGAAIDQLGGQGEPSPVSLKQYDHVAYGPFLGVSDEGSAAVNIRGAALCSPKMRVVGHAGPIVVGVSHDAERLAAVGEVAVGPSEYREIRLGCMGRIMTSTNVGTRLNLRYYKQRPVVEIHSGPLDASIEEAKRDVKAILEPFWHTPDNIPRPVTVFVCFKTRMRSKRRLEILKKLANAFEKGDFCDPQCHKLGLLICVGRGKRGVKAVKDAIKLAKTAKLAKVAVKGVVLRQAEDKISMPGLLNYFNPEQTAELLRYAAEEDMPIGPRNVVDPDTVARNVWSGLNVARNMGLELGKYGLFPLTLDESDQVMEMIQGWFSSWTAAPAFYVDFPTTDSIDVYTESNIAEGIKKWLRIVSKHGIPVVLIDTADKDKGRKLLKNSPTDRVGILLLEQIAEIDAFANELGIKILWAGGVTVPQAFEMGKLGVFGIYVTSAAAVAKPVTGRYRRDMMLPKEKEPTFYGVYRVKLLLESGFLVGRLREYGFNDDADAIEHKANAFLKALRYNYEWDRIKSKQYELASRTAKAWKIYFSCRSSKRKNNPYRSLPE